METLKSGTSAAESPDQINARERLQAILEIQRKNKFRCETLTPENITMKDIIEISDFFRFIFNNAWGEFAVCTDCDSKMLDGMKLSAMQVFGTGEEYVPTKQMDELKTLPNCPCCSKPMELFHDPLRTLVLMRKKLEKNGHATLLRQENEGDRLSGFTFGYGATLKEECDGEWGNRYNYMRKRKPQHDRDFDTLLQKLRNSFPQSEFNENTEVFAWNCIATAPWARFSKPLAEMIRQFFSTIPTKHIEKYLIGEAKEGSFAYQQIFKWAGAKDVRGFLEGDNVVLAGPLKIGIPLFSNY